MTVETEIGKLTDPVERLSAFIREREKVRWHKENDLPVDNSGTGVKFWTDDPILREYRFCNVRREDDRVTVWIRKNWRVPHYDDPDLWFAMVVARFVNWPPTLNHIGYPVPWCGREFLEGMAAINYKGNKLYTGAYMVRAGEVKGEPKYVYQEREVFTPLWKARERLRPSKGDTLNSYHMLLGQFHGLGSFMAAQVVADLKYTEPLKSASDWRTFAASGPGSRRGLNRVLGRWVGSPWAEDDWRTELSRLHVKLGDMGALLETPDDTPIHAQDLQNCLCEFDKYERVRLGEGKPRAKYRSHAND